MTTPTTAPVPAQSELLPCPFCGSEGKLFPEVCSDENPSEVIGDAQVNCKGCGALVHDMTSDDAAAMWNRRSSIAPTAVKALDDDFGSDEFAHVASLMRQHLSDDASFRAVMSNNFNVILAALDRSALSPSAEPAPVEMDEPVAWLRIRSDGRRTFWETNVDGDCTPLYRRPQPAEGWREALEIAEAVARSVVERGASPGDENARQLQQIATRVLASPSREPDSGAVLDTGISDETKAALKAVDDNIRSAAAQMSRILVGVASPPVSASPADTEETAR